MDTRALYQKIIHYHKVDRVPTIVFEGFEEDTLERWHHEGLPAGQSPMDFLGMDKMVNLPVSFLPYPAFRPEVISEDEHAFVTTDPMGTTVKRLKSNPTMYYGCIDNPVKNREDWKRYQQLFLASSPGRLPDPLITEMKKYNEGEDLVVLHFWPFLFRFGFYALGMARFMTAFYDMPDLIHEMFDFWTSFVLETILPILPHVQIDLAEFSEDLAYKNGTHLSLQIYNEFFIPNQNRIVKELKQQGVQVIGLWTSGKMDGYIPTWMENNINCLMILEQQAGMDPLKIRASYGKDLLLIGGIAKEALIGGPEMMDAEIERLMPLIVQGGFIPAIDDMIPPEVPFEYYIHYVNRIQAIKL